MTLEMPCEDIPLYNWIGLVVSAMESRDMRRFSVGYIAIRNISSKLPQRDSSRLTANYVLVQSALGMNEHFPDNFRQRAAIEARRAFDKLPIPNLI